MSRACDFLKECGVFFVLTVNGGAPAGRPFGAVMEHEGALYISTADVKQVYAQLKTEPRVQLLALKSGTRSWMRLTGTAAECGEAAIKARMLEECPVLRKHFENADSPHYAVFRIDIEKEEMY